MKFFTNLSTRAKLFLSFGIIWCMFLIIIIFAYRGITDITASEKKLHDVNYEISFQMHDLMANQNFNRAAILDMILTNDVSTQLELEKTIKENIEIINTSVENLTLLYTDPLFQSQLKELKGYLEEYRKGREAEIAFIKAGSLEEAQKMGTGVQKDNFEKISLLAVKMGDDAQKSTDDQLATDQKQAKISIIIFIIQGIIALISSFILIMLMNRTIAQPLKFLTTTAKCIASGDLNVELKTDARKDEVGVLMQNFRKMVDSLKGMAIYAKKIASGDLTESFTPQSENDVLGNAFQQMLNNQRRMMKEIYEGVNLLGSSASEILAATTQVASGAAETATAISETTTTVEEVRMAAQMSNQKAGKVSENAQQVAQVTLAGEKAVNETISGMHDIQKQMETVANTIIRLSEQSLQIGGIIASVTDVADQSNLLAVNASIEAAKAGEHGKGFAVVAQEIKNLAQQSKQATILVRNILNDVQKATNAAVMATEQTSKAVETGVKQSTQAGDAIKLLAESSNKAVEAATQIVASSNQQVVGMDQIGAAMQNINQAGTENAASMVQAEKAAEGLHELGQKLELLVEQYKL